MTPSNLQKVLRLIVSLLILLFVIGCSTKGFVRQELARTRWERDSLLYAQGLEFKRVDSIVGALIGMLVAQADSNGELRRDITGLRRDLTMIRNDLNVEITQLKEPVQVRPAFVAIRTVPRGADIFIVPRSALDYSPTMEDSISRAGRVPGTSWSRYYRETTADTADIVLQATETAYAVFARLAGPGCTPSVVRRDLTFSRDTLTRVRIALPPCRR